MPAKRHPWKPSDLIVLRFLYPMTENGALGKRMRPRRTWSAVQNMANKLRLRKSPEFLASPVCRFQPGMTPWNLGKTGYMGANATSFSKGQMPHNHRPIGSERISKDGYRERKVAEPKRWKAVHVLVWEAKRGRVKRGHIVAFKVGADKLNPCLANLETITRAENMRRNTYHRYPKEVARLIQLRGVLNRQINRRELEKQNRGSSQSPVRDHREGEGRRHAARPRKGGSGAGASRHQQREGGKRFPQGNRRKQGNGLHSRRGTARASGAAGAR